jgi:hypothetical protein
VGVALVVALTAVCIPLERDGDGLVLFEPLCEESIVLPDLLFIKNYFHFKIYIFLCFVTLFLYE